MSNVLLGKRRISLSDNRQSESDASKKQRNDTSASQTVKLPPNATLLRLSGLYFDGVTRSAPVGEDIEIWAAYRVTSPNPFIDISMHPMTWSEEHKAFVFRLPEGPGAGSYTFQYQRSNFVGQYCGEDCGLFFPSDEQSPLLFLHPVATEPYVAYIYDEENAPRRNKQTVPPFDVWSEEMNRSFIDPSRDSRYTDVSIYEDLPNYPTLSSSSTDSFEEEEISDGDQPCFGFDGENAKELLRRHRLGHDLGSLIQTVWSGNRAWGVRVRTEPIPGSMKTQEFMDRRWMSSYRVRLTVEEVYVKPNFYEIPTEEISCNESEWRSRQL